MGIPSESAGHRWQSIEVQGKETFQNREYTKVGFFGHSIYLRNNAGEILIFNPDADRRKPG